MFKHRMEMRKVVWAIALLLIAVLSATLLSNVFSSPRTYAGTIQTIDGQKQVATTMSIAVTAASTALSTLPNDTASPIAEELADLSAPLFAIVCILYLEKFLITTFGWMSFTILIPGVCVLAGIYVFTKWPSLIRYIKKLIALVLALLCVIPFSAKVTQQVQETFSASVSQALSAVSSYTEEAEDVEKETNAFVAFFAGMKDDVVALVETAKNMLGLFTDAIAVLLITNCIIPILTAALFVWVLKSAVGINIPTESMVQLVQPKQKKLKKSEERQAS